MIEVQILIPLSDNSGVPFPSVCHLQFEQELLRLFAALTWGETLGHREKQMNAYTMLSGETVQYPDSPAEVASFLAKVRLAAANPNVSVNQLTELIYSSENPLLDTTILPGRAMVTKKVFENPVYHIMADQIGVKQIQLGLVKKEDWDTQFTISVPEAAEQLGITPGAVRAAITAKKLAAHFRNGQWYVNPNSIASYKVSNRGRKKSAEKR
jgi:hypothetical protein